MGDTAGMRHSLATSLPLALLLSSTAASAAPGYLIIAGGGATPADGDRALQALQAAKLGPVTVDPTWPRTLKSDDVAGLNPGFHIAVIGGCAKKAAAEAARDVIRLAVPGTYVRKVKAFPKALGCPQLSSIKSTGRGTKRATLAAHDKAPGVELVVFERPHMKKRSCTAVTLQLQHAAGKRPPRVLLEERLVPGSCETGGMLQRYRVERAEALLDRGFVLIGNDEVWNDNMSQSFELWTVACGALTRLGSINPPAGADVEIVLYAAEGRVHLSATPAGNPETDLDRVSFALDAQGCGFFTEKP